MFRQIYKNVLCLLIAIALITPQQVNAVSNSDFGNAHITPYQDPAGNLSKRYAVGFMSYEIWTNSAGQWTGKKPGDSVGSNELKHDYHFSFPGRTVKDVNVKMFSRNTPKHIEYFEESRAGDFEYLNKYFAEVSSVGTVMNLTGKGTSNVSFEIGITGRLNSPDIFDVIENEHSPGDFADDLRAYRYYYPILFEFTLNGLLEKSYFTVNGGNLSLLEPETFQSSAEDMVVDREYPNTPPTSANYEYVGYKKSTTGEAPEGEIIESAPPRLVYDGSFDNYKLYMYYRPKDSGTPDPPESGCTEPSPSDEIYVPLNDPEVSAMIEADSRGSERFDVLDGIPTTESLYGNVFAKSYLTQNRFVEMSGKCTFEITVNRDYELSWDPKKEVTKPDGTVGKEPDPQRETEIVTKTYTIEREYSYWQIDNLEVYEIDEAALWNYAFDGNGIQIQPSGYSPPNYATAETREYIPPSPSSTVEAPPGSKSGGEVKPDVSGEDLESFAQEEVEEVEVSNDTFTFNGTTIMDGSLTERAGNTPGQIPAPPEIDQNVLYSPGNLIPMWKTNKANQPSTGTIYYGIMRGNINGGSDVNYPIYNINPVTVHTPVVIYPDVSDDKEHNQKTRPATGRAAIILDRPFEIEMPNSGQHTHYKGYGYNNFLKYIGKKEVRFPFDVYEGDQKTRFHPKNTWIEVDKDEEIFTFFLPVWVDEGFYDVEFRTIAHNAPDDASEQTNANLDLTHHIAYDTVPVDVIGRVFDFRITDIADYNWEGVFSTAKGSATPTGARYWVGLNDIDGVPRGNSARYTLPIIPGSSPLYKNVVIKTGYHFKFDFKTKGNMMDKLDGIKITPTFYFVKKDGTQREPVDLYYHTNAKKFIKIGSADDKVERYVILNQRLRNVPVSQLTDTAGYKYDKYYTPAQLNGRSKQEYTNWYIDKYTKQKTPVGWFSLLILPEQLRTFIGPKTGLPYGVDEQRANTSVQKWYAEYSLPAAPYVVSKGLNIAEWGRTHGGLDEKSPIFLKDGYIIVNFNIETIQDGDTKNPYLQYINAPEMLPTGSQWKLEGFRSLVRDAYGYQYQLLQGDVVFYHANKSSRDDFQSMLPH